ncbi:MAG TPA: hypothetical protein VHI78_00440, partial [Bacteroidales bacterium]|nr:hypothetical protein [Bacteroidales bacterium]
MRKAMFLSACMLLYSGMVFSQLTSFDLSKYKLPDVKRKQLDLNFDLSESYNNNKAKPEDGETNSDTDFNFYNSTRIGYRSFVNTDRFQSDQYYFLGLSPEFLKQKNSGGDLDKKTEISTSFEIRSENRIYFRNQYFFEADINFYGGINNDKTTDKLSSYTVRDRQE